MIRQLHKFSVLVSSGHIEILEHDVISDGDREYFVGNHRRVLTPGDDVSGEHQMIQDFVKKGWTREMIAAAEARDAAAIV